MKTIFYAQTHDPAAYFRSVGYICIRSRRKLATPGSNSLDRVTSTSLNASYASNARMIRFTLLACLLLFSSSFPVKLPRSAGEGTEMSRMLAVDFEVFGVVQGNEITPPFRLELLSTIRRSCHWLSCLSFLKVSSSGRWVDRRAFWRKFGDHLRLPEIQFN